MFLSFFLFLQTGTGILAGIRQRGLFQTFFFNLLQTTFQILHAALYNIILLLLLLPLKSPKVFNLLSDSLPFCSSLTLFLHPCIPIICKSSLISSIHLFLGLPLILVPIGFYSKLFLGVLLSSIPIT